MPSPYNPWFGHPNDIWRGHYAASHSVFFSASSFHFLPPHSTITVFRHIHRNISMSMFMQDWEPRRCRTGHGLDAHGFVVQGGSRIHSYLGIWPTGQSGRDAALTRHPTKYRGLEWVELCFHSPIWLPGMHEVLTSKTAEASHYVKKSVDRSKCKTLLPSHTLTEIFLCWLHRTKLLFNSVISLEIIRESWSNPVMDRRPCSVTFCILVWHITIIKIHLYEGASAVSFSAWKIQGRELLRCFRTDRQTYKKGGWYFNGSEV
jgi:hypothetical protein